jgi:hypothetical protein
MPQHESDLAEAMALLRQAERRNPGPWVQHSIHVGLAARNIAERCVHLDPAIAQVMGLLHDIGRRVGVTAMRHGLDGYTFLRQQGLESVAKVCLTHSHSTGRIEEAFGEWDCTPDEYRFVQDYLASAEYDDYDRLIQLGDSLALPAGFCLLEKRMIDVALRYGVNAYTVAKWKKVFEIKRHFEAIAGTALYTLLPGVIENTFRE